MKPLTINNTRIGPGQPVFFIAEAGVNHNGDMRLAKKLADAALAAGADAVKFQTFTAKNVVTKIAGVASYQEKNFGKQESQLEMIKKFELTFDNFRELKEYCDSIGILFLSTPHSPDAVDFLDTIVPAFKTGSGDLTNLPLLKHLASKKKPIIMGTGMATVAEVDEAVETIKGAGNDQIVLLHATTSYPCPLGDVNLRCMIQMRERYPDLVTGYSDHTLGIEVPKLAVQEGAEVIEKHFTLDKNLPGPDHVASLNPVELAACVLAVKTRDAHINLNKELVMGSEKKEPTPAEKEISLLVRKSIIANCHIPQGTVITEDMLIIKRPGTGMHPRDLPRVVGKRAARDIEEDELLRREDLI